MAYENLMAALINSESGGNPHARNPNSSAGGLGQFTDSTWLETIAKHRPDIAQGKTKEQLLQLKFDPQLSQEMTAAHAQDNGAFLTSKGIEPTPGAIKLAHFAGPAGAAAIYADPGATVEALLGPKAVAANPFLRGKTGADAIQWAEGAMASPGKTQARTLAQSYAGGESGAENAPVAAAPGAMSGGGGNDALAGNPGVDRLKTALAGYDAEAAAQSEKLIADAQKLSGAGNWASTIGGPVLAAIGGYQQAKQADAKKADEEATIKALTEGVNVPPVVAALLKSTNPAYREAGMGALMKLQQPKPNETLAPGATVYDPNSKQAVFTAPDRPKVSDTAQRAMDAGLKPGTPEYAEYVKNGPEKQARLGNPVAQEAEIRKEYNAASKDFTTQLAGADRVNIGAKTDSAQGDIALVYGFMKMLDPTSVVREGEFATAEQTGGIPDRVRIMYNKAINGERLTPEMRADFVSQAKAQVGAARMRQDAMDERYSKIAKSHGLDPANVVTTFAPSPSATNEPPADPAPGQTAAPAQAPVIAVRPEGKTDVQLLQGAKAALASGASPAHVQAQLDAWQVKY